jgi:hypothetical protein
MNDTACNLPSCYSCNRVDQTELSENAGSLVTYLGEYAVITTPAPELDSAPAALALSMGFCELENMFITMVVLLGDENATLKQSYQLVEDDDFYRYWTRHDSYDNLKDAHAMVVEGVKSEWLDLSQGKGKEFFEERDANLLKMKSEVASSSGLPWDGQL